VRQQPVGIHLRFIYAVLKMVSGLERIGDYAESMCRQIVLLQNLGADYESLPFEELADASIKMFRDAVQAFADRDLEKARQLMDIEDVADNLRFKINQQIFELRAKGVLGDEAINPLLTIARRLERVADQAKSICQETYYVVTGENVRHSAASGYNILFVDDDNAIISQMAEGIANSLQKPKFRFFSAGINPQPIHPMIVGFMAEKGINISEQKPKSVAEVTGKETIHGVILLSPHIKPSQLSLPLTTIVIEWPMKMPKMKPNDPGALFPHLEKAFDSLRANICDLIEAISGENL
ncbi:MAG: hypothetical protein ONA69_07845, partial [candidate division KSB1 bacterium]|nr:hypothetical protein [candidate division KSB1 bacterium]